jgi:hypothetical protein
VFLTLLAALVWFAPTLIALSPLQKPLLAWAAGGFDGKLSVDKASLGWLSPVVVEGLIAEDSAGNQLAEVPSLRTERSLASLIWARDDLGRIHLERPRVRCELRPDGSNLEDTLWKFLDGPRDDRPPSAVDLQIEDGVVEVVEIGTGKQWVVEGLDLHVNMPGNDKTPATMQLSSQVTDAGGVRANLTAEGQWSISADASEGNQGEGNINVRTSALPLDLPAAILKRFSPEMQVAGLLTTGLDVAWQGGLRELRINQFEIESFSWTDPTWMGPDRVSVPLICVAGQVTRAGDAWQLDDLALASDVANLNVRGTVGPVDPTADVWTSRMLDALSQGELQAEGTLNAAELAAMLPTVLRIRRDAQISSGQVTLNLRSAAADNRHRWSARLLAEQVAAMYQNRRIAWDQPIEVTLEAHQDAAGLALDQLTCNSSFLSLVAQGSLEQGSLSLNGDLARFRAETGQFVDLGGMELQGTLQGDIHWRQDNSQRLLFEGNATADDFKLVTRHGRPWEESKLSVQFEGTARTADPNSPALEAGILKMMSGADELAIELLKPARIQSAADWSVRLRAIGDISNWMSRIQVAAPLKGLDLDGGMDLEAIAYLSSSRWDLLVSQCRIQDWYCRTAGLRIAEPVIQVDGELVWDRSQSQWRVKQGTLVSTSVAARVNDVLVTATEPGFAITGQTVYRVQLERVGEWLTDTNSHPLRRLAGEAKGQVRLTHADSATNIEGNAEVKDFAYVVAAGTSEARVSPTGLAQTSTAVWSEPKLELAINGDYDNEQDTLKLEYIRIAGQSLDVSATGHIADLRNRCVIQLEGQADYDLEPLIRQLGRDFSGHLQMVGNDTSAFALRGPLFSPVGAQAASNATIRPASSGGQSTSAAVSKVDLAALEGRARLAWKAAAIEGISLGPGAIDTTLVDGVLAASPLEIKVSQGLARLAPRLHLTRSPMMLTLPPGTTAEGIQLTPDMCRRWLKYVAPLVAEAAAAEGTLSVSLDKTQVPVAQPSESEVRGTLTVHAARVGPGPLSRALLTTAAQVKALVDGQPLAAARPVADRWLEMPPQNVSFVMANQQVTHRGLQLVVDDVVITTRGSVSLGQSLNLIAEVPIQEEWVAKNRYLASLQGQVLRLPIQGTLKNPRVDGGVLARLGQQTLGGAASQLLEQEMQRGLQRLFGPRE